MSIPTTIESLSTTAASNGPAGTDDRSTADDGLRQAYAFIKQSVSLGSNIASASTITPPSTGSVFNVTGTTSITTIASTNSWDGRIVTFIFAGALTLTHSSNLALPGSANITTAANDIATFVQTASGAWRCSAYEGSAGGALLNGNVTIATPSSGVGLTLTALAASYGLTANGASANPAAAATGFAVRLDGAYGGGLLFVDATDNWGIWDTGGVLSFGSGTSLGALTAKLSIAKAGNVTINAPSSGYGINIPTGTPASAAASGTAGDIAWDSSFIYVCTATNTWKRVAIATW
jgi:hypothetical protein